MAKAILLDIEGTTTSIDFVHETLFPFARARVGDYVAANFDQIDEEIEQLRVEHAKEEQYEKDFNPDSPQSLSEYLRFLIDADRKSTPLKSIQGKIWQQGYESGELKSVVFDDVPLAFERWNNARCTVAIYSSGSVLAQQLLFSYTNHGDLTPFISHYFDTKTGEKKSDESYSKIAEKLGLKEQEILFISDVLAELDAARAAGLQTALSIRDGNEEITEDFSHRAITSFVELE